MAGNPNAGQRSATVQQALSVVDLGRQASHGVRTFRPRPTRLALTRRRLADPGLPRLRHRRVQAGQVVVGQRAAQRARVPRRRRHRHLGAHGHPLRRPARGGGAVRPGRRHRRPRPASPSARPSPSTRWPGYVTESADVGGERPGQLGRGVAPPQAAQRRPRHRRHPRRRRPGLGPQRRHHRGAAHGRRGGVRVRRQPGVHRPRARVPADRPAHVPQRGVRAHQDRLLPGVAQDPRPQRRAPEAARASTADMLCVSSSLRVHALRANDRELNRESGFPELAGYLQNKIAANAEKLSVQGRGQRRGGGRRHARRPVPQRARGPRRPRGGPAGRRQPHRAQGQGRAPEERRVQVAADAERRRHRPAGRRRPRPARPAARRSPGRPTRRSRPATPPRRGTSSRPGSTAGWPRTWSTTTRSCTPGPRTLTARVAEHFGEDGADIVVDLDVANPTEVLTSVDANTDIDLDEDGHGRPGPGRPARQLRRYAHVRHAGPHGRPGHGQPRHHRHRPVHGPPALRGEKERQLNMRRSQARQAHRKYTDEVSFVVGKDSRDTLRRVAAAHARLLRRPGRGAAPARPARRSPPPSRRSSPTPATAPEAAARRRGRAQAHRACCATRPMRWRPS